MSWRLNCLFLVFQFINVLSAPLDQEEYTLQKEFPVKCYEELGCFDTGPPFYDPPERPLSFLPFDLEYINTTFLLYSPSNPKNPVIFTFDAQPQPSFDTDLDTKVIIHGYTAVVSFNDSLHMMKDALLENGNYNVIIVNWSDSNQPPYPQAVANARVVAAQLAQVINKLKPSSVHLIGHSLGAHLAGWTGKRINGIGRISGLDPAGPFFYNADPPARLYSDDAVFVDVIHTDGGTNYLDGLGTFEPIGDINFYPNGGQQQPGCNNLPLHTSFPEDYDPSQNSCSHQRAIDLFTSSIHGTCPFWGILCLNYEDFTSGNCNRRYMTKRGQNSRPVRNRMGYYASKTGLEKKGQRFYLLTTDSPPFCDQ